MFLNKYKCHIIIRLKGLTLSISEDLALYTDVDRYAYKLFGILSNNIVIKKPIDIECDMFHLNTRTLSGELKRLDGAENRNIPFSIACGDITDYIIGLSSAKTTVTALREMQRNASGEKAIRKLHLLGIKNTQDPT